jgi:hypothetical protein
LPSLFKMYTTTVYLHFWSCAYQPPQE